MINVNIYTALLGILLMILCLIMRLPEDEPQNEQEVDRNDHTEVMIK